MSVLAGETFALFDVQWNLNIPSESARGSLLAMIPAVEAMGGGHDHGGDW